ncbi:MAG: VOC family protein [Pseudomonadota bacterium]
MSVQRLSHIGICVSDLGRSLAFYRDALGFTELSRINVEGEHSERLLGIDGGKLEAVYLERDGTRIELLYYPDAGHLPQSSLPPINRLGLSHLSLRVADLDSTIETIIQSGGHCIDHTRVENSQWHTRVVFATDPDGLRIELLQAPGDPAALPG